MNSYNVRIPVHGYYIHRIQAGNDQEALEAANKSTYELLTEIDQAFPKLKGLGFGSFNGELQPSVAIINPDVSCFHCSSSDFKKVTTYEQKVQFTNGKFIEHDKQEAFIYQCATCGAILNKEKAAKLSKLLRG
jgi:hypothetical protein